MLTYTTHEGWVVTIDKTTFTVHTPDRQATYESWGDPHENLFGKHIKDWEMNRRTILLPGGAQFTLHAEGPQGVIYMVSIYEGFEAHQIETDTNTVIRSCVIDMDAAQREAAEYDGETARLSITASGSLLFENVYKQQAADDGTPLEKVETPQPLGEAWPALHRVDDYYDDPRLSYT